MMSCFDEGVFKMSLWDAQPTPTYYDDIVLHRRHA